MTLYVSGEMTLTLTLKGLNNMRGIYKKDIRHSVDKLIDTKTVIDEWDNIRKTLVSIDMTPAEFKEFVSALDDGLVNYQRINIAKGTVTYRNIPINRRAM